MKANNNGWLNKKETITKRRNYEVRSDILHLANGYNAMLRVASHRECAAKRADD